MAGKRKRKDEGRLLAVIMVYAPGGDVTQFGGPPSARACGKMLGWQIVGFRPGRGRVLVHEYASWIYSTEQEAIDELRRVRTRRLKAARKRAK